MNNFYSILNIVDSKNVTDEEVKEKYDRAMKTALKERERLEKLLESVEMSGERTRIKHKLEKNSEYRLLIQDAYAATKNRYARENYNNLRNSIHEHMDIKREKAERASRKASDLEASRKLSDLVKKAHEANEEDARNMQLLKDVINKHTMKKKDTQEKGLDR